jgi:hypothetical protein
MTRKKAVKYILLLLVPFILGPLDAFLSELIWNYISYRESVGFLAATYTKENKYRTRADTHASREIRT